MAHATQDQWPALYDVTGVAGDDRLNIRAAPSAEAEIIGSLAHDKNDVEVIRPNARETWGAVNVGETVGWVALAYLKRQPGQWLGSMPRVCKCFGTEPFWSLEFGDERRMRYSTLEGETPGRREEIWHGEGRRELHAISFRLDSEEGPIGGLAVLSLDGCTDGMSDREYGIRADLLIGNYGNRRLISGCCSLSAPPAE